MTDSQKRKFKVGDRINVYFRGTVLGVDEEPEEYPYRVQLDWEDCFSWWEEGDLHPADEGGGK